MLQPPDGVRFLPAAGAWEGSGYLALFGQRITDGQAVVLYAVATMTSARLVPDSTGADPSAGLVWDGKDLLFAQRSDHQTPAPSSTATPLTAALYDFVAANAQPLDVQLPAGSTLLCGC